MSFDDYSKPSHETRWDDIYTCVNMYTIILISRQRVSSSKIKKNDQSDIGYVFWIQKHCKKRQDTLVKYFTLKPYNHI